MGNRKRISVVIADGHDLVRAGVVALMAAESDMEVVGEAEDGPGAVALYRRYHPDVLILELGLKRKDTIEVMNEVFAVNRKAKILILTSQDGDYDITRAFRAGAKGYVLKGNPKQEYLNAVRAVHEGHKVTPPEIAARLIEHISSELLTPRELDVLRRVAAGKANKEIAYELEVSEGTAKTHVGNILQKLGCGSRAEAVAVAVRRGFLHL
jgi:DNA-binding NarL/FixJ family response regulator